MSLSSFAARWGVAGWGVADRGSAVPHPAGPSHHTSMTLRAAGEMAGADCVGPTPPT